MKQSLRTLFFLFSLFINFSFLIISFKNDFKPYVASFFARKLPKKYAFIDLGVGKGDDAYDFFQKEIKNPELSSLLLLDNDANVSKIKWDVYLVEANQYFDSYLINIKKNLIKFGHSVYVLNQTAAWTYDGIVPFYIDTNEDSNFGSSSLR